MERIIYKNENGRVKIGEKTGGRITSYTVYYCEWIVHSGDHKDHAKEEALSWEGMGEAAAEERLLHYIGPENGGYDKSWPAW